MESPVAKLEQQRNRRYKTWFEKQLSLSLILNRTILGHNRYNTRYEFYGKPCNKCIEIFLNPKNSMLMILLFLQVTKQVKESISCLNM